MLPRQNTLIGNPVVMLSEGGEPDTIVPIHALVKDKHDQNVRVKYIGTLNQGPFSNNETQDLSQFANIALQDGSGDRILSITLAAYDELNAKILDLKVKSK